jgi:hypothetical protein
MSYETGRYLRRQDAKLPTGQRIEATAPVRVRVKSCRSGIGMAAVEIVSDYTGRAVDPPEPTRMDIQALRAFYRLEPINREDPERERAAVEYRIHKDDLRARGRGV